MGRYKKPIELKIMQGNPGEKKLPRKKAAKKTEEEFSPALPLEGYAVEYWDKFYNMLKLQGVLKSSDVVELSMLAYYCGKFREITEQVKVEDISCQSDKGNCYQNPLWGALNTCQDKIQKMLIQFGMTPVARDAVFNKTEVSENPFLSL